MMSSQSNNANKQIHDNVYQFNYAKKMPQLPDWENVLSRFNCFKTKHQYDDGKVRYEHKHDSTGNQNSNSWMSKRQFGIYAHDTRHRCHRTSRLDRYPKDSLHRCNDLLDKVSSHFYNNVDLIYRSIIAHRVDFINSATMARGRPIRGMFFETSLFPHGDNLAEDWLNSWDERPECPRTKWTYREVNPTWQPPIQSRYDGEYTATELIQARGDDVMIPFSCSTNFHPTTRAQNWQSTKSKNPDF